MISRVIDCYWFNSGNNKNDFQGYVPLWFADSDIVGIMSVVSVCVRNWLTLRADTQRSTTALWYFRDISSNDEMGTFLTPGSFCRLVLLHFGYHHMHIDTYARLCNALYQHEQKHTQNEGGGCVKLYLWLCWCSSSNFSELGSDFSFLEHVFYHRVYSSVSGLTQAQTRPFPACHWGRACCFFAAMLCLCSPPPCYQHGNNHLTTWRRWIFKQSVTSAEPEFCFPHQVKESIDGTSLSSCTKAGCYCLHKHSNNAVFPV